jgi:hypothetical protein
LTKGNDKASQIWYNKNHKRGAFLCTEKRIEVHKDRYTCCV